MKKLVASIMLLLYFVVSTGFVVSVHFCMDEVNAVSIGSGEEDDCGKCCQAPAEYDNCCKDEVKVVKVQADQLHSKLVKADFSLQVIGSAATPYLFTPLFTTIANPVPVAHGPPLSQQDTYLRNCVFRI
jgi:hypothetical protein